jgi:hypothetical protein
MSVLPNQSAINDSTDLWQPNNTIIATNVARTTGAITLGQTSSLFFASTITSIPRMSYYSYVNGSVQLSNIGGAGSNMSMSLAVQDPNGYVVSSPPQTITGSNATAFDFTLPLVSQSPNTRLFFSILNSGSANTGTANVTLFTNSVVSPLGENVTSRNFFA